MGPYDPDGWSAADSAKDTAEQAPKTGRAAAGSLTSVQIRRKRPPRKCGPAAGLAPGAKRSAQAGETIGQAASRTTHPGPKPAHSTADTMPARETPQPEEITAYWSRLRGSRRYASTLDLDSDRIASDWPNSILFRCRPGSNALEPDTTYRPRQGGGSMAPDSEPEPGTIVLSPMMLQWLLSLAGEAVRHRRPVEDTEFFPSAKRSVGYRAVALPLSEDQTAIDHVLCHVRKA